MRINNRKLVKAQSMLEYLITLSAIIFAIVVSTVGLNAGINMGFINTQNNIANTIKNDKPPAEVMQEPYYTVATEHTSDSQWQTVAYGGPQYRNEYYYHEGPSDMSYAPESGKVLSSDTGFTAPPTAGPITTRNPGARGN